MYYWEVQNTGTETRQECCSSEVRCLSASPTRGVAISWQPAYQDGLGLLILFPYQTHLTAGEVKARHDTFSTYSQGVQHDLPLASCIPMATSLLPLIHPGRFWRCFFYSFLFICFVLLFFYRSTLIFFCVLMHCEAKERFSWPVRSGTCAVAGIVYGQLLYDRAKRHISNICRMHMKNFTVISEEKGIRSMKRIIQLWSRDENN